MDVSPPVVKNVSSTFADTMFNLVATSRVSPIVDSVGILLSDDGIDTVDRCKLLVLETSSAVSATEVTIDSVDATIVISFSILFEDASDVSPTIAINVEPATTFKSVSVDV